MNVFPIEALTKAASNWSCVVIQIGISGTNEGHKSLYHLPRALARGLHLGSWDRALALQKDYQF